MQCSICGAGAARENVYLCKHTALLCVACSTEQIHTAPCPICNCTADEADPVVEEEVADDETDNEHIEEEDGGIDTEKFVSSVVSEAVAKTTSATLDDHLKASLTRSNTVAKDAADDILSVDDKVYLCTCAQCPAPSIPSLTDAIGVIRTIHIRGSKTEALVEWHDGSLRRLKMIDTRALMKIHPEQIVETTQTETTTEKEQQKPDTVAEINKPKTAPAFCRGCHRLHCICVASNSLKV